MAKVFALLMLLTIQIKPASAIGAYHYVTSWLNCTQYIPDAMLGYMQNTTPSAKDVIPFSILSACLLGQDYDPSVPAFFFKNSSDIRFGISISEVVSLEFNGNLQVKVSLSYYWSEARLRWPLNSGVNNWMWPNAILLKNSQVWPLIFEVLNCPLQDCELRPQNNTYVFVNNSGTVQFQMRALAFAKCVLNFTFFPFDTQSCYLLLAPKNYLLYKWLGVSYSIKLWTGSMSYVYDSDEWKILSVDTKVAEASEILMKKNTPNNFTMEIYDRGNSSVNCSITLERRPSYFIYNLIVPLLVIVCLNIVTVFIPFSAIEKPNMVFSVFLAFTFYQLLLAENTPKSDIVPYIGYYIIWSFFLTAFNLLTTLIVLKIHRSHKDDNHPPKFIIKFVIYPIRKTLSSLNKAWHWIVLKINRQTCVNLIDNG